MRHIKRLGYVVLAITMVTVSLVSWSCAPKPAQELPPIKIGALLDYTGPMAEWGTIMERAMKWKLDQVGWEVAGRKIELIIQDGGADPVATVDKAKKMVEQDKVVAIIGPIMSDAAAAVALYLKPFGIPYLAIMDHSHTILEAGNVFLPGGCLDEFPYVLGVYAAQQLGFRKAAVIYPDYVWGQESSQGFKRGFATQGGEAIQMLPTGTFELDFAPYLGSIGDNIDCIAYAAFAGNMPIFIRQYKEFGLKQPLLLMKGSLLLPDLMAELGDDALGIVTAEQYTSWIDTKANQDFVAEFQTRFGEKPEVNEVNTWISTTAVIEAIKATKGDTSPDKLLAAVREVKVEAPQGQIEFMPNGMTKHAVYILRAEKRGGEYCWIPIQEYQHTNRDILMK